MKDSTELERKRGTSEQLDPGAPDGSRNPGTEPELDPQDQTDVEDDGEGEAGRVDQSGDLTDDELGET